MKFRLREPFIQESIYISITFWASKTNVLALFVVVTVFITQQKDEKCKLRFKYLFTSDS